MKDGASKVVNAAEITERSGAGFVIVAEKPRAAHGVDVAVIGAVGVALEQDMFERGDEAVNLIEGVFFVVGTVKPADLGAFH